MKLCKEKNITDTLMIVGGIIPPDEVPALKAAGVAEIFPPGTRMDSIVEFVRKNLKREV